MASSIASQFPYAAVKSEFGNQPKAEIVCPVVGSCEFPMKSLIADGLETSGKPEVFIL